MKIAIKNNQTIKIYKGQSSFKALSEFIKKEFQLSPNKYTLTYLDQDGDNITLASNQDMKTATELNGQKRLLKAKINLTNAEEEDQSQVFQVIQSSPSVQEEVKVVQKVIEEEIKEQTNEVKEEIKKEEVHEKKWHKWAHWGHWGHKKQHHKQSSESSSEKHHGGFRKFHKIIDEVITSKVDERIKTLIPCLVAQIKGGNPIKTFSVQSSIVHQNTDCKSCFASPIVGIRYKCLTCPSFNLCENCQQTVQHEHNLLKIKKSLLENQKEDFPFKFMKKWWKNHRGEKSCSSSKEKCGGKKITSKLAKIFGGKQQDYAEFAKSNESLKKFDLISKFAKQNGVTQKLVNFRCEKIAKRLDKKPEEFKKIVEENLNLKPRQIIGKLVDSGEVDISSKWGKCRREQRKQRKSNGGKHHHQHEKATCQRKASKKAYQKKFLPTMLASGSSQRTGKAKILENLVTLFGPNYTKQYFDLIEQHFSMGQQAIIDKWLQLQASV